MEEIGAPGQQGIVVPLPGLGTTLPNPRGAVPVKPLDEAGRTVQSMPFVAGRFAYRAIHYSAAAALAPIMMSAIGVSVAGAHGGQLGLSLGFWQSGELLHLAVGEAGQSAFTPALLGLQVAHKLWEATCLALTGQLSADSASQQQACPSPSCISALSSDGPQASRAQGISGHGPLDDVTLRPACTVGKVRRKVVIVSLSSGGGHDAAAGAVSDALAGLYDTVVVKPFDRGSDNYNAAQRQGMGPLLDLFGLAQQMIDIFHEATCISDLLYAEELDRILEREEADVLISTVPMENAAMWRAAQRRKIPMLIIPTDLDAAHWIRNIHHPSDQFRLLLPFSHMRSQAAHLPESAIAVSGYPLRREFTDAWQTLQGSHPIPPVWAGLGIAANDGVILLMMGAQGIGREVILADVHTLGQSLMTGLAKKMRGGQPMAPAYRKVHVIVLCGHHQHLQDELLAIGEGYKDGDLVVHALGPQHAQDMSALMQRAQLLITKPGGATVNEALAVNVPMLFHGDLHVAAWEMANANYAVSENRATWVSQADLLETVINKLAHPRNHDAFPCPGRKFPEHLRAIVKELVQIESG